MFAMLYMLFRALILASRSSNVLVTRYEYWRRKQVTKIVLDYVKDINRDTKIQGTIHQVQQSCDIYDLNIIMYKRDKKSKQAIISKPSIKLSITYC